MKLNPIKKAEGRYQELDRAIYIKRSLGVRTAAHYMKRRGWSMESALFWLTGREPC